MEPTMERNAMERTRQAKCGWRWMGVLLLVGLPLTGCNGDSNSPDTSDAATVKPIAGSKVSEVTVSAAAAKRIDLRTTSVSGAVGASSTQVPYSAILYDPDGGTWVFAKIEGLTFVRKPIKVAEVTGDTALLTSGPPLGTSVVTVGAAELYGAEIGVGDE